MKTNAGGETTGKASAESAITTHETRGEQRPTERVRRRITPPPINERETNMEGIDPNLLLAKMTNGNDDDKTLWLFLLLLLYGRRGFGDDGGGGVRSPATLQDLNASQNAISSSILDVNRDIATNGTRNERGQAQILQTVQNCCADMLQASCNTDAKIFAAQSALSVGQKDICQQISDCCCQLGLSIKDVERAISDCCCQLGIGQKELQNALERCCCETQNQLQMGFANVNHQICLQTNEITQAIHSDGESTRALITQNRMDDLQSALQIAREENSNLRQTERLTAIIREQCGHGHHGWGGRGVEVATAAKK